MRHRFAAAALVLAAAAAPDRAAAQVSFFTNQAAVDAAAATALEADFEGLSEGTLPGALTLGRVTFTALGGSTLYVATPGGAAEGSFNPGVRPLASNVLTANGNEMFDLTFSGGAPTALSMLLLPNNSTGPIIRVFDLADNQIGFFTLLDLGAPRFLGLTSTAPIGRVNYEAVNGQFEDTGLDNVRVGSIAAVPEPATVWLVGAGLAAAGVGARRRRR